MKAPAAAHVLAFSYLRFSSPQQAEGDSLRRQTKLRESWLKRNPQVRLDTSLTLEDKGVSGFTGENRRNQKHGLAIFLDMVQRGRVPAGSYLIVENLDRLTRENPVVSIPVVLSLISAGIRIVQLEPTEIVYDTEMDQGKLMMMLWDLCRGHGESKRKAGMLGHVWQEKKEKARMNKTPHGPQVPRWLELADGQYRIREDAGRAVRLIFRWSMEGLGTLAITKRLNVECVPPISPKRMRNGVMVGERWIRSYVQKILDSRAVLGEYQPMKGHKGKTPDGEPIPGYYPVVVSDEVWFAAHGAIQARNKRSGRPGKKGSFLFAFSGLLNCALDRCPLHVITRKGRKLLCSAHAVGGQDGAHWCTFPLETFTTAVLGELVELKASDLFSDPGAARLGEINGRLADVERRLAVALQRFDADPESKTWADQVTKYDREKRSLVEELYEATREAANPLSRAWAEAVELAAQEDPVRLRAALLQTVESIWCLLLTSERDKLVAVQVWFKGGAHRAYLIFRRQAMGGAAGTRPSDTWCRTLEVAPADLDLRKPAHALRLERVLRAAIRQGQVDQFAAPEER